MLARCKYTYNIKVYQLCFIERFYVRSTHIQGIYKWFQKTRNTDCIFQKYTCYYEIHLVYQRKFLFLFF